MAQALYGTLAEFCVVLRIEAARPGALLRAPISRRGTSSRRRLTAVLPAPWLGTERLRLVRFLTADWRVPVKELQTVRQLAVKCGYYSAMAMVFADEAYRWPSREYRSDRR